MRVVTVLLLIICPRGAMTQEDWDVVVEPESESVSKSELESESRADWDVSADVGANTAQLREGSVPAEQKDFSLLGGDNLSWSGRFENQLSVFTLPRQRTAPSSSGWDVMDYNRLRIDLSARQARGFRFNADVVARTFHGTTRYDLRNMVAHRYDPELDLLAASDPAAVRFELEHEIFIDNAFFTADAGPFRLRVGKQQMRFGSGYLWNPVDPFNNKDLLDPTYEVPGVTAMRMQFFLPHEGLLEAYMLPLNRFNEFHAEDVSGVLRARIAVDRWVAALTYAYFQDLIGVDRTTFEPLDARRSMFGLELTGEIASIGVWGEGAFNLTDRRQGSARVEPFGDPNCGGLERLCWFEALAGANYTFEGGVIVQAEYLYNGRGYPGSDGYALVDWFAYLEQTVRYLGVHYVTGMVQAPVAQLHLTLTAVVIANLSDGSLLVTPWIQWDWSQYLAVTLYGGISVADDAIDEFRAVGQAGYLRFRFSF